MPLKTRKKKKPPKFRKKITAGAPETSEPDICPICHEDLKPSENLKKTHCSHTFHEQCLARWCQYNDPCTCPMCKKILNYTDINAPETREEREQLDRMILNYSGMLEGLTEAEVAAFREQALTDIRRRAAANAEIEREINAEMAENWPQNRRPSRISRVMTALFRRARGKRRKKTRRRKNPKKK